MCAAVTLEQPKAGSAPGQVSQGGKRGQPSTMSSSSRVLHLGWSGCGSLHEESFPSPAPYLHTPHTNCPECINGSTEGCFIIKVIAVFSRVTFASGVD